MQRSHTVCQSVLRPFYQASLACGLALAKDVHQKGQDRKRGGSQTKATCVDQHVEFSRKCSI